ncbi:PTS sugar transporter subunit IIA [Erysipelothrix aquatica]|uniref:PTS sugar transporter subunit IIA n=1 Tax=Erysipelothrix aquatica TaxID=2683714 RepID=UPI001F1DB228|nr:PTS glucose transporter subunit IIA [Erysipelothrix aquatica]
MFFKRKKKATDESYGAFGTGTVLSLEQVPDPVFAQKMMGDGYAIELTDGTIVAPSEGEVTVVFPTGHAYGIVREDGVEILVHLGIDTVQLEGKGFVSHVKVGDKVSRGDTLATMDLELIKEAGKSIISPMIITSGQAITLHRDGETVTPTTDDIFSVNA